MEFEADPVAADVLHNAVSVLFRMGMDRFADIPEEAPGLYLRQSQVAALLGDPHQILLLLRHVPDHEHTGGVGKITVQNCRAVDVHNVPVPEHDVLGRNPVADLIVDRGADGLGKALIVQRGRNAAHAVGDVVDDIVDFQGRHTLVNLLGHLVQAGHVDFGALFDLLHLLRGLDHLVVRHLVALHPGLFNPPVKILVAVLVLLPAPAPAGVVSVQFHFLSNASFSLSHY